MDLVLLTLILSILMGYNKNAIYAFIQQDQQQHQNLRLDSSMASSIKVGMRMVVKKGEYGVGQKGTMVHRLDADSTPGGLFKMDGGWVPTDYYQKGESIWFPFKDIVFEDPKEAESDDDSFTGFYRQHFGHHPKQESDEQYVKEMETARRESKERRGDPNFEKQYEEWWKKYTKDDTSPNLLLKEQLRSRIQFKPTQNK